MIDYARRACTPRCGTQARSSPAVKRWRTRQVRVIRAKSTCSGKPNENKGCRTNALWAHACVQRKHLPQRPGRSCRCCREGNPVDGLTVPFQLTYLCASGHCANVHVPAVADIATSRGRAFVHHPKIQLYLCSCSPWFAGIRRASPPAKVQCVCWLPLCKQSPQSPSRAAGPDTAKLWQCDAGLKYAIYRICHPSSTRSG
jgi:hypothetical protein